MCDQQRLRPACAYAQTDQSHCWSLKYYSTVNLLTQHHLEFLNLKGGSTGSSESTFVKMPHCRKSHVTAHIWITNKRNIIKESYIIHGQQYRKTLPKLRTLKLLLRANNPGLGDKKKQTDYRFPLLARRISRSLFLDVGLALQDQLS